MRRKYILLSAILFLSHVANYGLPRFALRLNDKCSSCHYNPTGGEMRTEDGMIFGKNIISMISPRDQDFLISPKITNNISIGFDYRTQYLYASEKKRSDFQEMTGSGYLNVSISDKINVLARYDFVQSLWEGYGVAKILPNDSYIKIGTFVPNFGLHLDDHTAYTRGGDYGLLFSKGAVQGLIYNPLYTETGIELGVNLTDNILITGSVGRSKSNSTFISDPTWTARLELTPSLDKFHFIFGGSYTARKTKIADLNTGIIDQLPSQLYGGFAGIGYKNFTLMGEYDLASDYINSNIKSDALMIEATYQLFVGLEAVIRYDRFNKNTDVENDSYSHFIAGFEFFPYSFVELRPQFRVNMHGPDEKSNSFVLQFHFWY